jgi:hypothetical protein
MPKRKRSLTVFDRICAMLALAVGVFLLIDGIVGLFVGSAAWYRFPPVLGVLPALCGWGILRCFYVAWYAKPAVRDIPTTTATTAITHLEPPPSSNATSPSTSHT